MDIERYIDHTILKPATTGNDIQQLCNEAVLYGFVAVCVPPCYVAIAKQLLQGHNTKIATVIGFPFGYNSTSSKLQEIKDAIAAGADEVDMAHNIAMLKNGSWDYLINEAKACTTLTHQSGKIIKVIIESGILTDEEIIKCCDTYALLGIDFMKTSTGYADKGASVHAISLMRKHLPETIAIKASGSIRTYVFAKELIDAGATRIGCSASTGIVKERKEA